MGYWVLGVVVLDDTVHNGYRSICMFCLLLQSITRDMIKSLVVISQLDKKFIVTRLEVPNLKCVILVDQHAADERIRVEALLKQATVLHTNPTTLQVEAHPGEAVQLCPVMTTVSSQHGTRTGVSVAQLSDNPHMFHLITQHRHLLERWYWTFELVGSSDTILLKTAPSFLGEMLTVNDMVLYLEKLSEFASASTVPPGIHRIANYKACRSAVMFGDWLDRVQCEAIIQQLSQCDLPFQCAHGRPSMTILFKY